MCHIRQSHLSIEFRRVFCTLRVMKHPETAVAIVKESAPSVAEPSASAGGRCEPVRRRLDLLVGMLVVVLTGIALWIRLYGLQGWDGTLTVDEARLALAARGVIETGLPALPSGWLYTRGLLATYLTA